MRLVDSGALMTTERDTQPVGDEVADQAAPLDALLVEAALGPLRRFTPDASTARFALRLAGQAVPRQGDQLGVGAAGLQGCVGVVEAARRGLAEDGAGVGPGERRRAREDLAQEDP